VLPRREKLLKDSVDPICTVSKIEKEEPRRETPNMENDDARRPKLLNDSDDPSCK
jgi:hypothetical protein